MKSRLALTLISMLMVYGASGCGYSTASLHPGDVRTVAVPIFQSNEFRRDLEFELTQAVIKDIELHTPYKVTVKERADTILEGTVLNLTESVLTEDQRANSTQVMVAISASYQWKDLRTGQIRASGLPQQSWQYAPREGQTLRSAQTAAIKRLARSIVEGMENPW